MPRLGDPRDLRVAVSFLRALRGWNQKELAAAAGIDKSLISLYELGKQAPSRRTLERLASAAGVPFAVVEQLLAFVVRVRAVATDNQPAGGVRAGTGGETAADAVADVVAEAVRQTAMGILALEPALRSGQEGEPAPPAASDRLSGPSAPAPRASG